MSIINQNSNTCSLDPWNLQDFLSLDFPFPPVHFPSLRRETQVKWMETPTAHICRAVFPAPYNEQVLVYIDDDNMLQISTEDGNFMSKFKVPENAKRDQIETSMVHGMLTIVLPKQEAQVRVIQISGSD